MMWIRLAMLACGVAVTAGMQAQPTRPVPVVVELFTAEGCSSCPPADALLIELIRSQPVQGALVLGLGEHVDYWNHLGWTDRFSTAGFTSRQSDYAAAIRSLDIYTPQMIVDGSARLVGSDRSAALAAIAQAAAIPKAPLRLTWTATVPLTLDVSLEKNAVTANAKVWLAITEDGLTSSVTRGENGGRELRHGGVTRVLSAIGQTDRDGAAYLSTPIRLDRSWNRAALRLIVFAQNRQRVVAAGTIDFQ